MRIPKRKFLKMKRHFGLLILLGFIFLLSGCEDDLQPTPPVTTVYTDGVLIVNEGLFNNGTGTVTYAKRDGSVLQQKIYQEANSGLPIGSIAQSMTVVGDKAYILVNNANTIEVVDRNTFKLITTIQNIELPRYMLKITETKSYVTCWDGKIKVLNTAKDELLTEIAARTAQEKLLNVDDKVWVLNQGGLGIDSTITVINPGNNQIEDSISVYPRPTGICEDNQGLIWVMCSGRASNHPGDASEGHLIAINKSSYQIVKDFVFPDNIKQPSDLIINAIGNELFYMYPGGINRFQILEDTLILNPFISYSGSYYSLGFDSKEDKIWASDAQDYVQNGTVFIYDAATGIEERTFKAGIVPSYFLFSN